MTMVLHIWGLTPDMIIDPANDQLTHLIDVTFSDVEKFESFHLRSHCYTLQSLYTALDHQLEDGLVAQHESDHMEPIQLEVATSCN